MRYDYCLEVIHLYLTPFYFKVILRMVSWIWFPEFSHQYPFFYVKWQHFLFVRAVLNDSSSLSFRRASILDFSQSFRVDLVENVQNPRRNGCAPNETQSICSKNHSQLKILRVPHQRQLKSVPNSKPFITRSARNTPELKIAILSEGGPLARGEWTEREKVKRAGVALALLPVYI